MYKLYKITNTVNEKLYIGITKLPIEQRWAKHLKDSLSPKYPLHHAINKYGKENFIIELLEESIDRTYISKLEEPSILKYNSRNNGYNVAKGGYGGDLGPKVNNKRKQTVKNLSEAKKQEWSNNLSRARLGKKHSIQTKEKLSQLQKDRGGYGPKSHSATTKEKISNGNKGKIRSEIARQNYKKSASIRGTGPQLQGKRVGCLCCNKEWDLGNFTKHIRKKHEFQ